MPRGDASGGRPITKTTREGPPLRAVPGVAGPTLPPPTGSRRRPRLGVLAAWRAGTAAEAPAPEASGSCQPWLEPAWQPDAFKDRAAQAPPPARREDVTGRGGGTFVRARGGTRRGAGPLPGSRVTRMYGLQRQVIGTMTKTSEKKGCWDPCLCENVLYTAQLAAWRRWSCCFQGVLQNWIRGILQGAIKD